jgi:hypothetical protein
MPPKPKEDSPEKGPGKSRPEVLAPRRDGARKAQQEFGGR